MTGTHPDAPHAEHDKYSTATGLSLTSSAATRDSLQPVSSSVVSDLVCAEGNIQSTPSLAVDTVCFDSDGYTKKVYTEEQTLQLLERIDGLYSNLITKDLTRAEEAKMELLSHSIKTCGRIFGYSLFDKGIGKENGDELGVKFADICYDARMSVYTAEEIFKDGPSHKAASRWLESLNGIEKSLVHPSDYIKFAPRYSHSIPVPSFELNI